MVVCADCDNNCCNAMTGKLADGRQCGCKQAYEHQSMYCKDKNSVKFIRDVRDKKNAGWQKQ